MNPIIDYNLTFTTKFLASCKSLSLSSFSRSGYSIWLKARDKAFTLCAFHSCTRWLNSSYRNTMSNTLKTFGTKGKFCFFSPRNDSTFNFLVIYAFTTVFVDTRLWKTKHSRKRFQNFRQSCVLMTDRIEIHKYSPIA